MHCETTLLKVLGLVALASSCVTYPVGSEVESSAPAQALHARVPPSSNVVFMADFEVFSSAIDPGAATMEGVQGYDGLGTSESQFRGHFLRSPTGNKVTLMLTGLPAHRAVSLKFLLAAIDSLDGTGDFPSGDYFEVAVDDVLVFRESFANAVPTQIQSYVPPPGVELARHADLGFAGPGSYYTDSAYNLGADPVFSGIPHSAPTLKVSMQVVGVGIQPLNDESWAIENLAVMTIPLDGC